MKCREVVKSTNISGIVEHNVVWFGSLGKNADGTANWYNSNHDSYESEQEGVRTSLQQRLSVIRNELWYNINYGLPLFEKQKSKTVLDSTVLTIISSHPDVRSIQSFTSTVVNRHYSCKFTVITTYGELEVTY